MNKIIERIFKNKKPDFNRLEKYGFKTEGGSRIYATQIMDGQFSLAVKVTADGVETTVTDLATEEPYTLFLAEGAEGGFVGSVRSAYEIALADIAQNCFDSFVFKSEVSEAVIKYVGEKYGDKPEFLWEKFSDNAVLRRSDNKKWYAVILTVTKNKLGLNSDEKVEIIDLRADPEEIGRMVDGKIIFGGWHMNKKHWITVCLDGSLPPEDICRMIDISYNLAK
ncbi:MAG: MmcQ/YjbR family DNA-binding protein [Clostridia bacterium]|nr:MmcQ/YjbR family DNA-binding protein [Clostridia bacterium]